MPAVTKDWDSFDKESFYREDYLKVLS
jgi:hypothetical protein